MTIFLQAKKPGLKAGDIILAADGQEVKTMEELNAIKNSHKIGEELKLKIYRNGNESEITVTLEEKP